MTLTEYTNQRLKVDKYDSLSHDIAMEAEWVRYLEDTIDQTQYGDWMFTITADDGNWRRFHTNPIQIRANKNDFMEFLKDYLQKDIEKKIKELDEL